MKTISARRKKLPVALAEPERGSAAQQIEQDYTTFDCLAYYAVVHLEDAASDDAAVRRRFGRFVGVLADHAACARDRLPALIRVARRFAPA